jgi:hypothetical protein
MPITEARVPTTRADRYLAQLCEHLGRMQHEGGPGAGPADGPTAGPPAGQAGPSAGQGAGHGGPPPVRDVDRADDHARIEFDWGSFEFTASPDDLTLRVSADDPQAMARGQEMLQRRIETIGRRDQLTVTWQPVTSE